MSEGFVSIQEATLQGADEEQRYHTIRRYHIAAIVSLKPIGMAAGHWLLILNAHISFTAWWRKTIARCLCSAPVRKSDRAIWCWAACSSTNYSIWWNWASSHTKACKNSKTTKSAHASNRVWCSTDHNGPNRRSCAVSSLCLSMHSIATRSIIYGCRVLSMSSV